MSDLGKKCLYYRAKNNLTQAQLADMLSVSLVTISNIERGIPVSKKTALRLRILIGAENED